MTPSLFGESDDEVSEALDTHDFDAKNDDGRGTHAEPGVASIRANPVKVESPEPPSCQPRQDDNPAKESFHTSDAASEPLAVKIECDSDCPPPTPHDHSKHSENILPSPTIDEPGTEKMKSTSRMYHIKEPSVNHQATFSQPPASKHAFENCPRERRPNSRSEILRKGQRLLDLVAHLDQCLRREGFGIPDSFYHIGWHQYYLARAWRPESRMMPTMFETAKAMSGPAYLGAASGGHARAREVLRKAETFANSVMGAVQQYGI